MKPPKWFRELLGKEGAKILKRESTDEDAIARLTKHILTNQDEDPPFSHRLIAEYAHRQLKMWISQHRQPAPGADDSGQLDLFPDIPHKVEIAPGRFVDQAFMTRKDWTAAVRQAETKASNAGGFAEAIKRIADKVLPLLINDELTTADVWRSEGPGPAGEVSA
jgi:hypothetical protein